MKNIAFFCIPAHGHTNPMLPVARELKRRGNKVRFYSFEEFREKIEKTGADFIPCDACFPSLSEEQKTQLMNVSTTEMTIQDIRITINMNDFLEKEIRDFQPDVIYTDSVCFWGKLNAWKYKIPLVVSTSTFAFNQLSSQYMKSSPKEMADLIFGLPKISKKLKKLKSYGYNVKSTLALVQNDNDTDTVVYTSRKFQPYSKSFSEHYAFVGPSVFSDAAPDKAKPRPLVYISMGTVINDRPDFYKKCIEALKDADADVIISCGTYVAQKELGNVPGNIKVYPRVDQLEVLSRADVFITHCGMNSVSESLYMATPMVFYPQTNEQNAVALRAAEIGAGIRLKDDSAAGIAEAVRTVLSEKAYAEAAAECSKDFRACGGAGEAADFIENAPHVIPDYTDVVKELNKKAAPHRLLYWCVVAAIIVLFGSVIGWKYVWIIGIAAGVFNGFYEKLLMKGMIKKSNLK